MDVLLSASFNLEGLPATRFRSSVTHHGVPFGCSLYLLRVENSMNLGLIDPGVTSSHWVLSVAGGHTPTLVQSQTALSLSNMNRA